MFFPEPAESGPSFFEDRRSRLREVLLASAVEDWNEQRDGSTNPLIISHIFLDEPFIVNQLTDLVPGRMSIVVGSIFSPPEIEENELKALTSKVFLFWIDTV